MSQPTRTLVHDGQRPIDREDQAALVSGRRSRQPAVSIAVVRLLDRLYDWSLQEIAFLLEDTLTPRGISQRFTVRNRLLGGRRPLDVLRELAVDAVRQAAVSFADGGYA